MEEKIILLRITKAMLDNCPFSETRCSWCLSQACLPDPMKDVDFDNDLCEDEES